MFKSAEESLTIYNDVLTKATDRITKDDTFGLFPSVNNYMICFNCMCEDIAQRDYGLSAADFQHLADCNDLTAKQEVQPLFARISDAII